MKYKVGDKVRVRSDLKIGYDYGGIRFLDTMENFKGEIVTLSLVDGDTFKFEEDLYWFSFEMIEGLATVQADVPRKDRIVIERWGNELVASFYIDDKLIKQGEAKCHPKDKFNFKLGAELALERMWEQAGYKKHWYFSTEKYKADSDLSAWHTQLALETWVKILEGKQVDNDVFCDERGNITVLDRPRPYCVKKAWCEYR